MWTQQLTLLKRLRMRPMGVVSKNMTWVPTSLCSEFWCTCIEANRSVLNMTVKTSRHCLS